MGSLDWGLECLGFLCQLVRNWGAQKNGGFYKESDFICTFFSTRRKSDNQRVWGPHASNK
jgi:hypothetical protein